ncbi:MAG: Tim44 domain-containing protein [Actinomycetota bacterium]|nr:Tim44 domain-containing protein [Actinomycetota bacterium]
MVPGLAAMLRRGGCLAAGLLLTACAQHGQPVALPVLPAAAPAASAVPGAPAGNDTGETAQGAADFVRSYFERLNAAYLTRDLSAVRRLVDPRCRSCANFAGDITAMVAAGHRLEGDSFQVVSADAPPVVNHVAVVDLLFRSPGPVEFEATGRVLLHRPGTAGTVYVVTVVRTAAGWRIREIGLP